MATMDSAADPHFTTTVILDRRDTDRLKQIGAEQHRPSLSAMLRYVTTAFIAEYDRQTQESTAA